MMRVTPPTISFSMSLSAAGKGGGGGLFGMSALGFQAMSSGFSVILLLHLV